MGTQIVYKCSHKCAACRNTKNKGQFLQYFINYGDEAFLPLRCGNETNIESYKAFSKAHYITINPS